MADIQTTPLNKIHLKLGAKMVPFAGFDMPVQYTTIVEEHHRVRKNVGLFDLCHMGRIRVAGEEALDFLQFMVTNNLAKMNPGSAHYTLICNEKGTVLDDLIVYNLGNSYLVVCNASNRPKILSWLKDHQGQYKVQLDDLSDSMGMIAIQGFQSPPVVSSLLQQDLSSLNYYSCLELEWLGVPVILARTGYTGEDGFEIYLDNSKLESAWESAMEAGKDQGIAPVGLGARDTLRLEAAMPLYGQELTEKTNPLEAGLKFAVKFKKGDYIGKEALLSVKKEGIKRKLVCMEVASRRIARTQAKIFRDGREVGEVTSGTLSPTLQKSIAMGYVPVEFSQVDCEFQVEIGRKQYPLKVIPRPFYKRKQ